MKLLYVTDNGFCKKDGKYFYSAPNVAHINNLSRFFDKFVVIAREDTYENGYHEKKDNMDVILVSKFNIYKLQQIIKNEIKDCDAIICYGCNGYFASKIGKKFKKVVISYNGGDPYDFCISRGNFKGRLLAPIARYLCKESFKNSDYGHYCDEFLFERYPANGEMMACSGVNIECDDKILEKRLKKIDKFDENKMIKLGLIGHTKNSLKGIDIAIKAIGSLGKNYCLEIVGRGDYSSYLKLASECKCSDRIRFLGALAPGEELFGWLDNLDIYIQPSRIEGLPRATIEAMSRGCPAVTSDAGALRKLVNSNYVFSVNEPWLLPDLIKKISVSSELKEQAIQNFEKSKNYEISVRDKKYDKFYSKIIEEINNRKRMH